MSTPIDYHRPLIERNGVDNASGFSKRSQQIRFDKIIRHLNKPDFTLLDYGCNICDLYDRLITEKMPCTRYTGVEINSTFQQRAIEKWGRCNTIPFNCTCLNILKDDDFSIMRPHTYVVASGVFSYPLEDWRTIYPSMVKRLYSLAEDTLIFNALTTRNPFEQSKVDVLFSPEYVLQIVSACHCNSFAIEHDYLHNDMMIVMRKTWTDYQ